MRKRERFSESQGKRDLQTQRERVREVKRETQTEREIEK